MWSKSPIASIEEFRKLNVRSLLETCKLNAVDPLAWTTDVLTKLVNRWPASRIDELMPWAYAAKAS
jgi:hypothetical protein